jgi:3-Oxoacyl-[acyl-carrier-protein (ACP)] synthase III
MTAIGIRHLSFEPGDQKTWYRDLPDIEERIRRLKIPDEEDLWNWGYCHRASDDFQAHVARGFARLTGELAAAGVEVDTVLVCGPVQSSTEELLRALDSGVLPKIAHKGLRRVDDRDCANVMQAIADARELLRDGAEHVLILAAEKMEDEQTRFRKYSMFSDFCFALLLSSRVDECEYEILDVHVGRDENPGEDTSGILTRQLEKTCVEEVLARNGVTRKDVGRFFYLNLYEPIAEMKGKETGFTRRQLYSESRETGHCYGADPFINMHGFIAANGGNDLHVLCASGRAHAGVSLVRRRQ